MTIKTEDDYKVALERLEKLWDAEAGSAEEKELEELAVEVENYEKLTLD